MCGGMLRSGLRMREHKPGRGVVSGGRQFAGGMDRGRGGEFMCVRRGEAASRMVGRAYPKNCSLDVPLAFSTER